MPRQQRALPAGAAPDPGGGAGQRIPAGRRPPHPVMTDPQRAAFPRQAARAQQKAKETLGKDTQSGKASCTPRKNRKTGLEDKPELWRAAEEGEAARLRDILGRTPASLPKPVDVKVQGWTPLMKAAENDDLPILHILLGARANVSEANKRGRTALSFAAAPSNGSGTPPPQEGAYALLLRAAADPERKDARGASPRSHLALRRSATLTATPMVR